MKLSDSDKNENQEPWHKTLLPVDATLEQAIRNLEESALKIALVTTADGILIGTLTDGDIRRGILRGSNLKNSIDPVIQREPLVAPPELDRDMVLQLMRANKIQQLPVVDPERRVVGLHLLDDLIVPGKRSNLMVIMAGGQGVRMRPHTENCPKPLLPVAGKPILEHIIERAREEGFHRFILAIHYLGQLVEKHFGDGSRWQVDIDYLREDSPLGTAGAISLLDPRPEAPFLVTNGDVLTDISYGDLLDFHCRHRAVATMAVRQHEWQHPFGVVEADGIEFIGFEEKPIAVSHINAGIYVLDPTAMDALKPGEPCDMPTLFNHLLENEARPIVYPMHEPWLDVGREEDLNRANTTT